MVPLGVSSMLMNQQYILNKVSLSRNTYKTRVRIDRLTKKVVSRGSNHLTLYRGAMVSYSLTPCS